jgi:hypothetical protein
LPVIRLALPARRVDVITSTNEVMTLGWLPPACAGAADETTDVHPGLPIKRREQSSHLAEIELHVRSYQERP